LIHDIPAKSRLLPTVPITSPRFVYRQARETDVRATFARARAGLESGSERDPSPGPRAPEPNALPTARNDELGARIRMVR
jgi:hypothetical protein